MRNQGFRLGRDGGAYRATRALPCCTRGAVPPGSCRRPHASEHHEPQAGLGLGSVIDSEVQFAHGVPSAPEAITTGLNFPTSVTVSHGRDCPTPKSAVAAQHG
jgi:hypothetical protein